MNYIVTITYTEHIEYLGDKDGCIEHFHRLIESGEISTNQFEIDVIEDYY